MGRRMLLGVAVMLGLVTPSAFPEAAPVKATALTRLTHATSNGESTLLAEGRGITFSKRVGRDRVVMRLEVPRDRIDFEVNMNGQIRVVRNGKVLAVEMRHDTAGAMARIQKLTLGSPALAGFDSLVASAANDQRIEAQSLRVSHALLHAVRGNTGPALMFAGRQPARSDSGIVRAMGLTAGEGPAACWAEYASTMNDYLVQFNSCTENYWWIPGWNAACAAQFSLQGELAFFWLLSCSGGMPV